MKVNFALILYFTIVKKVRKFVNGEKLSELVSQNQSWLSYTKCILYVKFSVYKLL